jgi:hypothetical protein
MPLTVATRLWNSWQAFVAADGKLFLVDHEQTYLWLQIFQVSTTALKSFLQPQIVLQDYCAITRVQYCCLSQSHCYSMLLCLLTHQQPIVSMSQAFVILPLTCKNSLTDISIQVFPRADILAADIYSPVIMSKCDVEGDKGGGSSSRYWWQRRKNLLLSNLL